MCHGTVYPIPRRAGALRLVLCFIVSAILSGLLVGSSHAQTLAVTFHSTADHVDYSPQVYSVVAYSAIGPGGSHVGAKIIGYLPVNGGCGTDAVQHPALVVYRSYGEHVGPICSWSGASQGPWTLPTPTSCLSGWSIIAGKCVLNSSSGTVPGTGAWDFPTNQLLHVIALCVFAFMGFRQGAPYLV